MTDETEATKPDAEETSVVTTQTGLQADPDLQEMADYDDLAQSKTRIESKLRKMKNWCHRLTNWIIASRTKEGEMLSELQDIMKMPDE